MEESESLPPNPVEVPPDTHRGAQTFLSIATFLLVSAVAAAGGLCWMNGGQETVTTKTKSWWTIAKTAVDDPTRLRSDENGNLYVAPKRSPGDPYGPFDEFD